MTQKQEPFSISKFIDYLQVSPRKTRKLNRAHAITRALIQTGFTPGQLRSVKIENCTVHPDNPKMVILKAPSPTGRGYLERYLPFTTFGYLRSHCSGGYLLGRRKRSGRVAVFSRRAIYAIVHRTTSDFGHPMSCMKLRLACAKQALLDTFDEAEPSELQAYYQLSEEQFETIVSTLYSEFTEVS